VRNLYILLFLFIPSLLPAQPAPRIIKQVTDSVFHVGDIVKIPVILYDLGKASIRPEAKDSLDVVVKFLEKNKHLGVEIGSHTDSRGSEEFNRKLSSARAKNCYDYIVSQGISPQQITYRGYGESELIHSDGHISKFKTKEEQESLHQQNRRTELKVLSTWYGKTWKQLLQEKPVHGSFPIVVIPVMYDLGKAAIRPESFDSLDAVVDFMNRNPSLVIEIANHSDSRVSDAMSSRPTDARAKSCAGYLISKGISPQRIVPKGYGDKKLIIKDAEIAKLKTKEEQELAHQKNRRTEIKILRFDYVEPAAQPK
jgi:outer membrane protein OmpA-like peptidoglycan-associated protein